MTTMETLANVLTNYNLMHFATIDADGLPCVRGVDFTLGDVDNVLYFVTHKGSRKVAQISANPNIAFAIDKDCTNSEDLSQLKYVKGIGTALLIDTPEEMEKAFDLLLKKFPYFADLPLPTSDLVGIKVFLKNVLVTDNSISFGNTEEVNF